MTSGQTIKRLTATMILATVLMLCAAAQAKVAVVYLKDRPEPLKGELVSQTSDKLILKIAGIDTPINKADVVRMEFEKSLTEQYREKRAVIANDDYPQRYQLAYWAYQQGTLEGDRLAAAELAAVLQVKPDFKEAKLLSELVLQRIKAATQPKQPAPTTPAPTAPAATTPTAPVPGAVPGADVKVPLLERDDVNLIKVIELDLRIKPAVTISPKVIDDFLNEYRANKAVEPYLGPNGVRKFKGLKGYEQVEVMFAAKAAKFYKDIIVRDEPKALSDFRQTYYPTLVLRSCGSCHGDGKAAGLYVITHNATREDVAYTNFLILTRTGTRGEPLIDRATPADSLLLQYGLPRDQAKFPHPDVKGFKPYFNNTTDASFTNAADWIASLLPSNGNDPYPVTYKVPATAKTEKK
ncbi:MAG: hypothetical protein WC058_11620 [Phycisphaeraceae bacterium]